MEKLSPEYVFFKMPLYAPVIISDENFEDFKRIVTFSLGNNRNSVEGYNPFRKNKSTTFVGYGHPGSENFQYLNEYGGLAGTSIRCVRDGDILTFYFHYDINTNAFMKVGQYPSLADFQLKDLDRYRAVLPKPKLKELAKAIGLAAHGVGIGSFVYLRRIFEDLISEAYDLAGKEQAIHAEQFRAARMDEKIVLLKDYLPGFLVENRSLYSILSAGIHALSEEDCLMHFDVVKVGIEMILDEKLEKAEKAARQKVATQKLAELTQKIKTDTKP